MTSIRARTTLQRALTAPAPLHTPLQLSVHDEGSCWLPAVLRPAVILSHWGRTDASHTSGSGWVRQGRGVHC